MYRDKDGKVKVDISAFIKIAIFILGLIIGFNLARSVDSKASILSEINLHPAKEDVELLASAISLENECNGNYAMYLTGAVILNRMRYCEWCPNDLYGVLTQKNQYEVAPRLLTNKTPISAYAIALRLLMLPNDVPHNVVFQSMQPNLGHGYYKVINGEYFAYE